MDSTAAPPPQTLSVYTQIARQAGDNDGSGNTVQLYPAPDVSRFQTNYHLDSVSPTSAVDQQWTAEPSPTDTGVSEDGTGKSSKRRISLACHSWYAASRFISSFIEHREQSHIQNKMRRRPPYMHQLHQASFALQLRHHRPTPRSRQESWHSYSWTQRDDHGQAQEEGKSRQ